MPEKYLSLNGECTTLKIIEKSRFITTSRHVSGEDDAKKFIAEINKKFPDATHNCYAYICDTAGNFLRFSDDGEPQGTAGMPMLEVLKTNGLREVAVVVTRYFGGIKLGAGGLVRAYSGCVAENLNSAEKVCFEECAEKEYRVNYAAAEAVVRFAEERGADVIKTDYSDGVTFIIVIKKSEEKVFDDGLCDRLNGKVKIAKKREYFFPFKI